MMWGELKLNNSLNKYHIICIFNRKLSMFSLVLWNPLKPIKPTLTIAYCSIVPTADCLIELLHISGPIFSKKRFGFDNLYIASDLNRFHCRHPKPNVNNESPKSEWHQNSTEWKSIKKIAQHPTESKKSIQNSNGCDTSTEPIQSAKFQFSKNLFMDAVWMRWCAELFVM